MFCPTVAVVANAAAASSRCAVLCVFHPFVQLAKAAFLALSRSVGARHSLSPFFCRRPGRLPSFFIFSHSGDVSVDGALSVRLLT